MINGDKAWQLGVGFGEGSTGIFSPGDVLLNELIFMEVKSVLGLAFDGFGRELCI